VLVRPLVAALGPRPVDQATAAMNAINLTVINPSFMTVLIVTTLVCVILAVGSLYSWT
jgi:uncharacterized membrane protein